MHGPFMIRAEDTPACRSPSGTHFAPELHLRSRSVSWRALLARPRISVDWRREWVSDSPVFCVVTRLTYANYHPTYPIPYTVRHTLHATLHHNLVLVTAQH